MYKVNVMNQGVSKYTTSVRHTSPSFWSALSSFMPYMNIQYCMVRLVRLRDLSATASYAAKALCQPPGFLQPSTSKFSAQIHWLALSNLLSPFLSLSFLQYTNLTHTHTNTHTHVCRTVVDTLAKLSLHPPGGFVWENHTNIFQLWIPCRTLLNF